MTPLDTTAPEPTRLVKLSPHDVRRIAVAAFKDDRTVTRAYDGEPVQPMTHAAIVDAAQRCGLPVPPPLARARRAA